MYQEPVGRAVSSLCIFSKRWHVSHSFLWLNAEDVEFLCVRSSRESLADRREKCSLGRTMLPWLIKSPPHIRSLFFLSAPCLTLCREDAMGSSSRLAGSLLLPSLAWLMYVINWHYLQTFQVWRQSTTPQRGGVQSKLLAFISGPNIVIESRKVCFEQALWCGHKDGRRTLRKHQMILKILTAWWTLSNSIFSEPVWGVGREREGERAKTKRKTEASHLNGGGGHSHLVSTLLEERTSLGILFSSKAQNHLVRVCARRWKSVLTEYEINRGEYLRVGVSVSACLLQGTLIYI